MKTTVNVHDFVDAFRIADRKESFSYLGRKALFEYLEELEEGIDEEIELDVISLCCDYAEYETALEAALEYGFEVDSEEDEAEQNQSALDWLYDQTSVIEFDGGVIVASF